MHLKLSGSVDREIDVEDNVRTLSWTSRQCNVDESAPLQRPGPEDKRQPFPDSEDHVRGRGVVRCKLLRTPAGVGDSPSEYMTSSAYRRIQKSSEVLASMEMWDAASKEHVKDTGREVADITMAN